MRTRAAHCHGAAAALREAEVEEPEPQPVVRQVEKPKQLREREGQQAAAAEEAGSFGEAQELQLSDVELILSEKGRRPAEARGPRWE